MKKILMLLAVIGTYAMATNVADMTVSQKQESVDKILKKDIVVFRETRNSRKVRTSRTSRVREVAIVSRKGRESEMKRAVRLSRKTRTLRHIIFFASL